MKTKILDDIVYRFAVSSDKPAILQFLRDYYFPDEPLVSSFGPKKQDTLYEEYKMSFIDAENKFCLLALYGNLIIGIRLFSPRSEQKLLTKASTVPGSSLEKILIILAELNQDSEAFGKYKNFKKVMHSNGLAVHKDFRKNGIGLKLMDKSMEIAKALGYSLFTIDCTNVYTMRMCEILGMECVKELKMEDFRFAESDEQVIFPDGKQNCMRTYVKVLEKSC